MTTSRSVPQLAEIRIVTDGACRGNPGPGGWAAIISDGTTTREIGGGEPHTTNNRMELRAAVEALRLVDPNKPVRIVTDSQYLINGATRWIRGWQRSGWLTKEEKPVEHRDLWEEIDRLAGSRVTWEYVRGHAGHPENERADRIAQSYADGQPIPARTSATIPSRGSSNTTDTSGPRYLSLVNGQLARHTTWDACKMRVHGASGALYKKCSSRAAEIATVTGWGLNPSALDTLA
ncbi:MAG: ribonuclease HI [Roseiflexaceae bacterium]|nr:ribonuclease HI [Roseiflexaceae bacterium]